MGGPERGSEALKRRHGGSTPLDALLSVESYVVTCIFSLILILPLISSTSSMSSITRNIHMLFVEHLAMMLLVELGL